MTHFDEIRKKLSQAGFPYPALWSDIRWLVERVELLERLDSEASTHVESTICMRTSFTGEPPYVGWKGLGLALTEALDDRDQMRSALDWIARNVDEKTAPLIVGRAKAALRFSLERASDKDPALPGARHD